jgi:biotin-dependent carboxylase-like uncharacterized protein
MTAAIVIEQPGLATTVQDLGRPGLAHIGVPPSGAVDTGLAAFVNRLVGNHPQAAVIETCGRLTVRARGAILVASSFEPAPISLRDGDRYRLEGGFGRLWHYLAVGGGIDVVGVLGSRSTDTLSGLGPPLVAAGDELAVGAPSGAPVTTDQAPLADLRRVARISPGPRLDWFEPATFERLVGSTLVVTASSRIGVRLAGAALRRRVGDELPSEGLVRGALQAPPGGELVMMSADHPTTGGYPVIAVVHPDDVAVVAQSEPGSELRFSAGHR